MPGLLLLLLAAGLVRRAGALEASTFLGEHVLAESAAPALIAPRGDAGFVVLDRQAPALRLYDRAFAYKGTVELPTPLRPALANVTTLDCNPGDGRIYCFDAAGRRAISFDAGGGAIRSLPLAVAAPLALDRPSVMTVDPTGRLYVADAGNNAVHAFTLEGTYLFALHKPANGRGRYPRFRPAAMTVLRDGALAVVESGDDKLLIFGRDGRLDETVPLEGRFRGIDRLIATAVGEIVGVDRRQRKIAKWSASGELAGAFGAAGAGRGLFGDLVDIAVDTDGALVALDGARRNVQVFAFATPARRVDETPRFAHALEERGVRDAGAAFVAFLADGVVTFDATRQTVFIERNGTNRAIHNPAFSAITAALVDDEHLCFFDRRHKQVFVHDAVSGAPAFTFRAPDGLADVRRMLPGPGGTRYVADAAATKVHVFSRDGIYLTSVGDKGSGAPGELGRVSDMCWVGDELAVLDGEKRWVHFYDGAGRFLRNIYLRLPSKHADLHRLGVGPDNTLFLLERRQRRTWVVDRRGNVAFAFGSGGERARDWRAPTDFDVDAAGSFRLYDAGPPARILAYRVDLPDALARAEIAASRDDWNAVVANLNAHLLRMEGEAPLRDAELDEAVRLAVAADTASHGRILIAALRTKAQDYLRKILAARPEDGATRLILARSLKWDGRAEEAILLLRDGHEALPFDERLAELHKTYVEELVSSGSAKTFVAIETCYVPVLFAALHQTYYDQPVIELKLNNSGPVATRAGRALFFAPAVMDYPTETPVPGLEPFSETTVMLRATFNRHAMTFVEATRLAAEVELQVGYGADELALTKNLTFELMGRNSIDWDKERMIASFITPKDPDIQAFMRQALKAASGQTIQANLDTHLYRAVALFDAIQSVGIYYQPDPRQPFNYSEFSGGGLVDYVQYPRETLLRQSGDCDDLAVLFASLLESSGIPSILVTSPGHIFAAFATEDGARSVEALGLSPDLLFEYEGEHYIPVEATLMDSPFVSAWRVAAGTIARYRPEGKIGVIDIEAAWRTYKAMSLPPTDEPIPLPSIQTLGGLMKRELDALNLKQVENRLAIFKVWLIDDPENTHLLMFLARSYAEVGVFEAAREYAERARQLTPDDAEVYQTLGNIAYMQNQAAEAIRQFRRADAIARTAAIQINLALAYLKDGQLLEARQAYESAEKLDKKLVNDYPELGNLLN